MSYFSTLGLTKEPFSNSPDPEFFFESNEHKAALIRLLVEIRLRRGLSVILGDVGVGKTTLSRKLFQMLKERTDILFYMILDPTAQSEELFLESLVRTFNLQDQISSAPSILDYKEIIKKLQELKRYDAYTEFDDDKENANTVVVSRPTGEFVRWSEIEELIKNNK